MSDIKRKPTEQANAINNEYPGNFLVTASASSGKTMVLVQRVIKWLKLNRPETKLRKIHDLKVQKQKFQQIQKSKSPAKNDYPNDIEHLLIVTFTRAAAKEIQSKIQKNINKQIASLRRKQDKVNNKINQPLINHLYRQLREVPVSDIGTLDAFCQKLVTNYYYIIKIDPEFRILTDSAEVEMLRDIVWTQIREDFYANDRHFVNLVRNFDSQSNSDDNLTNLVYSVYDYSRAKADPTKWLDSLAQNYTIGSSLTQSHFYQKHLYPSIYKILEHATDEMATAFNTANDNHLPKESEILAGDYRTVQDLLDSLKATYDPKHPKDHDANWDQIYNTLRNYKFSRFPGVKRKKETAIQQEAHYNAKDARDHAKETLSDLQNFFTQDARTNLRLMKQAQGLTSELVKVVKAFSQRYWAVKKQKRAFEFSDIEHLALDILTSKAQEGHDVKVQLQKYYNELLVDECQDNNQLQNQILTTIAKHTGKSANNLFMVGDPKQSIYRFRLADPEWFVDKQKQYADDDDKADHLCRLTYNFRSTENVDDFVNLIFDQIMPHYYDRGQLRFKATWYQSVDEQVNVPVRMMIYDSSTRPGHNDHSAAPGRHDNGSQSELRDSAHGQIRMIAKRIRSILDHRVQVYDKDASKLRDVQPKDIALISATRNDNLIISNIFKQFHIPVTLDGTQNYFKTTEIQIMMSLLQIIDNPYQDIPLVAVLRSPIVGLDENQLAYLRINAETGDYYHAVTNFAKTNPDKKYGQHLKKIINDFLQQLDEFRNVAKQHNLVDLIWFIYQKTGFLDYVGGMPNGKQRQANLHALYERAAEYEQSNFRGLFQFINFIHRMQDKDDDLTEAQDNQSSNTVSVITIHGSKGLQYPIVFLYDVSHHFNQTDVRNSYIINKMGLGINCFQPHQYTLLKPLQAQLIQTYEKNQSLDEERRKLYVALTRTKEQLYIVGTTRETPREKLIKGWQKNANDRSVKNPLLNDTARNEAKSYLDWLGAAMIGQADEGPDKKNPDQISYQSRKDCRARFRITFYNYHSIFGDADPYQDNKKKDWLKSFRQHAKQYLKHHKPTSTMKKMHRIMTFTYQHQDSTREAAYLSVSALRRAFEDPDDAEMSEYHRNEGRPINQYVNNDFAMPKFTQQTNQKPKATDVGTATHLVLQMISLKSAPTPESIQKLIIKLVKCKMITKPVAKLINQKNVLSFFNSFVGQLVLQHPKDYHRETPFSLLVNADQAFKQQKPKSNHDKVLVHGIIDGYLHYDHQIILVDYKTDYVDRHHIKNSEEKIKHRYREQLKLYAIALNKALKDPVKAKYLYLLNIQKLVPID